MRERVKALTPFLHYEHVECDHNGKKYIVNGHDILVDIPAGAIPEGMTFKFEIGVAVSGPFSFPENSRLISPILWIYPLEDYELKKPIQIILPHCFAGLTKEETNHDKVCFSQADIAIGGDETFYPFIQCQLAANFQNEENYGMLQSSLFGLFCIILLGKLENNTTNLNYCLAKVNLPPSTSSCEFHFYALLDLPSHKRVRLNLTALTYSVNLKLP